MKVRIHRENIIKALLLTEDTDGDKRITIDDQGPKLFILEVNDHTSVKIEGSYHLSNLLQELVFAPEQGLGQIDLETSKITESPVTRLTRMIREHYWDMLTRTVDEKGVLKMVADEKIGTTDHVLYVPFSDIQAQAYYSEIAKKLDSLRIAVLPEIITPEYVQSISQKPGLLVLSLDGVGDKMCGVPFVVPGGRFNEMYGWDSYFESIGLIVDGKVDMAKAMADNFDYQIRYYGKILNANRSYYLSRTQPPFFTSLIRRVFSNDEKKDLAWLKSRICTAIQEYHEVWMVPGIRLTENGLNRYYGEGLGVPTETEPNHFDAVFKRYAIKHNLSSIKFEIKYRNGEIKDQDLDLYFVHDRSIRESGHDTTNRLDDKSAHLNVVDLNALLYKYETDFAEVIDRYCEDALVMPDGMVYTSRYWLDISAERKARIQKYLWNEQESLFFDYNFVTHESNQFVSATSFYPLWSGICDANQAELLVRKLLPILKCPGGIVSTSEYSRGEVSIDRPQRQWDYPFGWAPHQIIVWEGLIRYGYIMEAQELIYRWLWMITKTAVDYNGVITEKYNVVLCTHKVHAEYGNVGSVFEYVPQGGFGWTNASYQYGLSLLNPALTDSLNQLILPDSIFKL